MLNLPSHEGFEKYFPQYGFEKSLCDHHISEQLAHLEVLIQIRLKGYYNNAIHGRISLDGYGSKIQKVSRCRPTVSNETILATKQEFFLTKVAPYKA